MNSLISLLDIDMVFHFKGESAIWLIISMLCLTTYYNLAASVFVLVMIKPCLPVVMASMIVPCEEDGSLITPDELSGIAILYIKITMFAFLDALVMFYCIGGPCIANIPGNYYMEVSLRRFVQHTIA